jgi:hypothetical protein
MLRRGSVEELDDYIVRVLLHHVGTGHYAAAVEVHDLVPVTASAIEHQEACRLYVDEHVMARVAGVMDGTHRLDGLAELAGLAMTMPSGRFRVESIGRPNPNALLWMALVSVPLGEDADGPATARFDVVAIDRRGSAALPLLKIRGDDDELAAARKGPSTGQTVGRWITNRVLYVPRSHPGRREIVKNARNKLEIVAPPDSKPVKLPRDLDIRTLVASTVADYFDTTEARTGADGGPPTASFLVRLMTPDGEVHDLTNVAPRPERSSRYNKLAYRVQKAVTTEAFSRRGDLIPFTGTLPGADHHDDDDVADAGMGGGPGTVRSLAMRDYSYSRVLDRMTLERIDATLTPTQSVVLWDWCDDVCQAVTAERLGTTVGAVESARQKIKQKARDQQRWSRDH